MTLSQTHSQSLSPDGTYTDAVTKSESVSVAGSIDTTYFAFDTDAVTATHTETTATSTTADGTRTQTQTTSDSSSGGGGGW